jgi:hypothetical protein
MVERWYRNGAIYSVDVGLFQDTNMDGVGDFAGMTSRLDYLSRLEDAWVPIPYWSSTAEVSGADVAETSYTCFAGTKDAIEVRLIVRRVRPTPGSQLALFTEWDYHAFVTDRDGEMLELEADHRRHAVVEQSIAELKSAGWAHAPSGRFVVRSARRQRLRLPRGWPWQTAFLTALDTITALPMRC